MMYYREDLVEREGGEIASRGRWRGEGQKLAAGAFPRKEGKTETQLGTRLERRPPALLSLQPASGSLRLQYDSWRLWRCGAMESVLGALSRLHFADSHATTPFSLSLSQIPLNTHAAAPYQSVYFPGPTYVPFSSAAARRRGTESGERRGASYSTRCSVLSRERVYLRGNVR